MPSYEKGPQEGPDERRTSWGTWAQETSSVPILSNGSGKAEGRPLLGALIYPNSVVGGGGGEDFKADSHLEVLKNFFGI